MEVSLFTNQSEDLLFSANQGGIVCMTFPTFIAGAHAYYSVWCLWLNKSHESSI